MISIQKILQRSHYNPWNIFDLDKMNGIPKKLLWHVISIHPGARIRMSSSGNGYHLETNGNCPICNVFSDKSQQLFRESGVITIYDAKKDFVGEWQDVSIEKTEYW